MITFLGGTISKDEINKIETESTQQIQQISTTTQSQKETKIQPRRSITPEERRAKRIGLQQRNQKIIIPTI